MEEHYLVSGEGEFTKISKNQLIFMFCLAAFLTLCLVSILLYLGIHLGWFEKIKELIVRVSLEARALIRAI